MRQLATGVALLGVLASGCSDGAEPPTTLPSLTASATPSAAAVPRPSGIDAPDAIGASAFAKYYFAEVTAAFDTLDTRTLRSVSHPDCGACNNFADNIERIKRGGGQVDGADFTLAYAETPPPQDGEALVDLRYTVSQTTERDAKGNEVKVEPARSDVDAQARVQFVAGRWTMRGIRDVTL